MIEATRKGKEFDANVAEASITDPVARKLAEWVILRSDNTNPTFNRYAAFVQANPSWPHAPLFRRRAENALWNDGVDASVVRAFFAKQPPTTAKGRFMLARVLLAQGDRTAAAALVRYAWRHDEFSADVEKKVLEMFGDMLSIADHKARMEARFYADDVAAGLRAAERLGGNELAIGRARAAVLRKAGNAKSLLDAVPTSAQRDAGYIFARVQWLRQNNKAEDASRLILTAPKDPESWSISISGGWSGVYWFVNCSTTMTRMPPTVWHAKPPRQCEAFTVSTHTSPLGGLRFAISTIRNQRPNILHVSWKERITRMLSPAVAIGRVEPPKRWASRLRLNNFTRWPENLRRPIMDSSREPGSA